jgi:hypothetical protein
MGSQDIVVFWVRRPTECADCGDEFHSGSFVRVEDNTARCLECADLGHLVFLARGDPALTRRAGKHSSLRAVVVQWSRARKRYERQGTLVEEEALEKAEVECLADSEVRAARRQRARKREDQRDQDYVREFAQAIARRYPECPTGLPDQVAAHACERYSGRVGRSAAAKALSDETIDLAVRAHIRHRHTAYDDLLMRGWGRDEAREAVRNEVDETLRLWRHGRSGRTRIASTADA